jgi:3-oxoacyl-[acyl-carrier-protein] synthase II
LGVVTSLGESVEEMWDNLCVGKSGIGPIKRWDPSTFSTRFGGECTNFDLAKYDVSRYTTERLQPKRFDRFGAFGVAASISAVNDANIDFEKTDRYRCGVIIGSGIGGIETLEEQNKILNTRGMSRVSPFTVPRLMVNAASGNVSIIFRLYGPNTAVATACATGANAIGDAARYIQHDQADLMIAGGSEAALCALGLGSFCAARALSTRNDDPPHASRPWDKDRDGFVMGEGAGVVVLEEFEHAKKRGAKIYCELVGYGMSADAYHITAPDEQGRGASRAMDLALKDAGLATDQIDYINAHGTGTPENDKMEYLGISTVFGERAKQIPVSSNKSMVGHTLSAAGAVEAVFSLLTLEHQRIPPTINYDIPDPAIPFDVVPNKARDARVTAIMSNSFGFGGQNAVLILTREPV